MIRSKHIINRLGKIISTIQYTTINDKGNETNKKSAHIIISRIARITNNSFNELYYNNIKRGAYLHNKKYRLATGQATSFTVINYFIEYISNKPTRIFYKQKGHKIKIIRNNKTSFYIEKKIINREGKSSSLYKEKKDTHIITMREYKKTFKEYEKEKIISRKKQDKRKRPYTRLFSF